MRNKTEPRYAVLRAANRNADLRSPKSILCVGLSAQHVTVLRQNLAEATPTCADIRYRDLDETLLDKYRPDLIVVPLFAETFDVVDVAETLSFAGFLGELWAIGPALPNPRIIEREISSFAGNIKFRVLTEPALQTLLGHEGRA